MTSNLSETTQYSGDLNTNHLNTKLFDLGFQMVQNSDGNLLAISYV